MVVTVAACSNDSGGGTTATTQGSASGLRVDAVSTRPEYVTGGDVLVEISSPSGASLDGLAVSVEGRDVTAAFSDQDGRLLGLVDGLPEGTSTIEATAGDQTGSLEVTDHPISGPLFSGPQQQPFVCTTEAAGLGPPTDQNCSVPTQTSTAQVGGVTATVEKGVIDRSIYTIAIPQSGWNRRLVYEFGGGCGTTYSQGSSAVDAEDPKLLGEGYAVVTSSLDTFATACNSVLSAEVALMTKEHFIEAYGLPDFTIGEGGSGGAIQQLQIAQNYPGILDGLAPTVPFPDAASIAPGVTDCGLLVRYYQTPDGSQLTDAQRTAINGHRTTGTCALWNRAFVPNVDATVGCAPQIPAAQIFNAETNPDGVRCTFQDSNVNIYGRDPATGFANRPLDNVGVQYGLAALEDGTITVDQFLALNEAIGGYDINGAHQDQRESASEESIQVAYSTGQVLSAARAMWDVPIILTNVYTDALGDIHDRQRIFAIRDRLTADGQRDPNLVLWTLPATGGLGETLAGNVPAGADAVSVLDQWLTAARADTSDQAMADKLAATKPTDAVDSCTLPSGQVVQGPTVNDDDPGCTQAYPVSADPRRVAGASLSNDIAKCQLVPVDPGSYRVQFSPTQLDRLRAAFPDGVCDWSQPGVGQVPMAGTWQSFG